MKKIFWLIPAFLTLSAIAFLGGYLIQKRSAVKTMASVIQAVQTTKDPVYKYGLNLSNFVVIDQRVERNELFADILSKHNIAVEGLNALLRQSKDIFNPSRMKAGTSYKVLGSNSDTGFVVQKLVYEESKTDYVVFNFDDSLYVHRGKLSVQRAHQQVAGVISGSLYETFDALQVPPALAVKLADIFSCTIDFYKIKEGDKFKILYDQDFVDGHPVGVGAITAAMFSTGGKDYSAYYFEKDAAHEGEYFDEKGESMRRQFLKAPVKFARISSRYNLHRFHPVDKVWRAHLGTDYAADYGTPILATADGMIEEARSGVYNGNYVKIRHNGQYKTQYLHMSKIARSMRAGKRVHQGEVIGYVGSTGLATGPHVCYRFWKDGQQVDPLRQKLKFSETMPKKYLSTFISATAQSRTTLSELAYGTKPVIPDLKAEQQRLMARTTDSLIKQWF
ncbi:MAG: peptidoglycan DD-metalloendopeptidase family protein [Chitinophagales bacterium]